MQPKLTVSGYRGIWGTTLTDDIAREYVRAFAAFVLARAAEGRPRILVARDGRESGPALLEAVSGELAACGLDVIDLGMMPTPSVVFLVRDQNVDGAIIITASHNPIEYNGLKFITASGAFTNEAEVAEIQNYFGQSAQSAASGVRTSGTQLFSRHINAILKNIDVAAIKAKHFKAALDPINSVGATTTPLLFDALGTTAAYINAEPTGKFAHAPEPLPKNLSGLQQLVRETKSDVGFAQDPDGDRLVICDETGTLPSEEVMLALCVKAILTKNLGDIVINLSTSNMCEDIAASFGKKTFRSKVGEANILAAMQEHDAVAGGEGSGGIIYPTINAARDSFVGIALILELMAREAKPLSEIIATLPNYFMQKEKFPFADSLPALYENLATAFPEAQKTTLDGLRLDLPNRAWLHIRPSNTEPVVRIIAEAKTAEETAALMTAARRLLVS